MTLLAALSLVGAPTASAHTELLWSTPDDGSVLSSVPTEVVLTFVDELLEASVKVAITDESGTVVAKDVAQADGADVTVSWPADLPPGTYSVNYRVVSADGHPVSGSVSFSYTGAAASPSASASPAAATATAVPTASPSPTPTPTAAVATQAGLPVLPIALGLLAILASGIVLTFAVRRRTAGRERP